jgi:putative CocE/NonD family hydrolase
VPAPTLLVRLPYGKDLTVLLAYGLMPNLFALIEAGYAVVYQDCRGTFRSGGEFVPMRSEPNGGADTIAWLVEQPWCDGNIGTFGASYLGFVQWASA